MQKRNAQAWNVFLNGKKIDTVFSFCDNPTDGETIRQGLIRECKDPSIVVTSAGRRTNKSINV